MTPVDRARGCVPEGSKIHFVQKVMLHIKSKVMKSRIQWCKHFSPGHVWGPLEAKKWDFGFYFLTVTQLLLGFFS